MPSSDFLLEPLLLACSCDATVPVGSAGTELGKEIDRVKGLTAIAFTGTGCRML